MRLRLADPREGGGLPQQVFATSTADERPYEAKHGGRDRVGRHSLTGESRARSLALKRMRPPVRLPQRPRGARDRALRALVRNAVRAGLLTVLAGSVGGCAWMSSWFAKTPKAAPTTVVAPTAPPEVDVDVQPATAARSACANYAQVVQSAPFPREAIIRGIDAGNATVRFRVDGTVVTVLSVRSSDPTFGNAASDVVQTLTCRVDRPTTFDVPFSWRTVR